MHGLMREGRREPVLYSTLSSRLLDNVYGEQGECAPADPNLY